ncbi:MGMT family protein [Burkholderia mayonis]|uniref:MGMT family protein n=1 Tax=Burkholderia mayonis TaxID=1385591 RepID=UPI003AB0C829
MSIIVPCHRIIGKDGSLTGYGGGIERKRCCSSTSGGMRMCRSRQPRQARRGEAGASARGAQPHRLLPAPHEHVSPRGGRTTPPRSAPRPPKTTTHRCRP